MKRHLKAMRRASGAAALSLAAALCALAPLAAEAADVIALWPEGAPNKSSITAPERTDEKGNIFNVTEARLEAEAPAHPNGKAVILMPGGGYSNLSMATIEESFGPFFREHGFTTFVLKYRLPNGNPEVPLADANKAVETVRSLFKQYGLHTVGVMGASAGGHLAAMASVACKGASCPDFSVLVYPNITMMLEETQPKSSCRRNLIGEARSVKYDAAFSAYKRVNLETPPAFLAVSAQDQLAGSLGSMLYARAMVENGRPVALHVYPTGNHGWRVGQTADFPDGDRFKADLDMWLETVK